MVLLEQDMGALTVIIAVIMGLVLGGFVIAQFGQTHIAWFIGCMIALWLPVGTGMIAREID